MVPASGIQERLLIGLSLFDSRDPVLAACIFAIQHLQDLRNREAQWGYNKTTKGTFVCDQIKGLFVAAVLYALILPFMLWIIHVAGPALIPSLIGFSIVLILLVNLLVPVFILPLFYTFTDLKEGELRTAIFAEAEKTGIPVS
jgi:STE24 endopeptidase